MSKYSFGESNIVAAILFVVMGTLAFAAVHLPSGLALETIIIDMQAKQPGTVNFFWNDNTVPPKQAKIVADQRTRLAFKAPNSRIYRIRFDPTQIPGNEIAVFGISMRLANGTEITIPLDKVLSSWTFVNVAAQHIENATLLMRATSEAAFFFGDFEEPSDWKDRLARTLRLQLPSDPVLTQAVILGAGVAALVCVDTSLATLFAVGVALLVLLFTGVHVLFSSILPPDSFDVATAVGQAAFLRTSLRPIQMASIVTAAFAVLLGSAISRRVKPTGGLDAQQYAAVSRSNGFVAILWILVVAVFTVPDIDMLRQVELVRPFPTSWDGANFITWMGFVVRGDRPFVDFWWPYSGLWMGYLPLPYGPLWTFAYNTVLFGVIGFATIRLFEARKIHGLTVATLIVLFSLAQIIGFHERYLLAPALVLSYAIIDRSTRSLLHGRACFSIACLLAFWGEPLQCAYAAPAIAFVLLYDEWGRRPVAVKGLIARVALDFCIPAFFLAALIVVLYQRGVLSAVLADNAELAAGGIYGATPTKLTNILQDAPGLVSIATFGPPTLIFLGILLLMRREVGIPHRILLAIVGCGLTGVMYAQKLFFRAPLTSQLISPTLIGALLLFSGLAIRGRGRWALAAMGGAVAGLIVVNTHTEWVAQRVKVNIFNRWSYALSALANPEPLISVSQAVYRRERFASHPDEIAVLDALKVDAEFNLYVLGDVPIFYLFSRRPPAYYTNLYNTSPIAAQIRVATWFANDPPDAIILDPKALIFDGFQNIVRLPVLIGTVIRTYAPERKIGPYYILRRRDSGQLIPLDFWVGVYGNRVEFGGLLQQIDTKAGSACAATERDTCVRYLPVKLSEDVSTDKPIELGIEAGTSQFKINFMPERGRRDYLLPIDRIWFWLAAEENGLTPTIKSPTGVSINSTVGRRSKGPILY